MFPITKPELDNILNDLQITDITAATIRQICALAARLESMSGEKFVHLEIGNPGLPSEEIGVEAEIAALKNGVANKYPDISGVPVLKESASNFLKSYLDIDVPASCIIPTVGSMQGSFSLMLLLKQRIKEKDTMLFINPGFPAQPYQAKLLGLKRETFDIFEFRGKKLEEKLESYLSKGNVTALIYSNPNNPAWINLTDEELEIIGRLATKYDVVVMEDLAYLGMDFRKDFGTPGEGPFVPSVAKYTDNYIVLVSGSKIFSYAGQRIALVCMSEKVFNRKYDDLASFYNLSRFGDAYIFGVLYALSSGTSHSAQYALAAMMQSAVAGKLNFVEHCREYGRRGERVKKIFTDNGFHIVYAIDGDQPISDGFFFTAGYKNLTSEELQKELMRYGVSSISLPSTGSLQNGIRVCVSMISDDATFADLDSRLKKFNDEH